MSTGDPATARGGPAGVDAFVSYTGADEAWALWVAAVLEAEGQRVRVQAWDSPAGTNVVGWINEQMTLAARTVAICSDAYFASHWCTQEWTGALAGNTLTPLRVADCAIPAVLATIAYRDLHGVDEPTARRRLVEAVGLAVPARVSPGFPGGPAGTPVGAMFPGGPSGHGATPTALADPRPPGAVRVIDADPYRLGVHRAIHMPGATDETLPAYVGRDIDHQPVTGIRARLRVAAARGGFVLLVGGSSAGKTRCALEAVTAELGDWWLIHPADTAQITTLVAAPPARTVLWLDEIQTYLNGEHGLTAGTVRTLLDAGLVLVGTIWPHRYRAFTTPPPPGARDDPHRWERDALRQAAVVDVDDQLTPTELARASAVAAHDPRIQAALDNPDDGLTQTLAAAPALVRRWTSARADAPYAWAIITAALDATRLGVRTPLTVDLLRAAVPDYCTPRQQATAPANWFEHALAYATTPLHGATAALNPVGAGMGQTAGYAPADYLLHHTTSARRLERGPASLWTALRDHLTHPDDIEPVGMAALNRRIYTVAVPLLRRQADAGGRYAAHRLAELLVEVGERHAAIDILHPHANAGDLHAVIQLVGLLVQASDLDGLRARANTGDELAAIHLAGLLFQAGDQDGLRARADAGDRHAAYRLARLLADAGDQDGLRARANAGDWYAAEYLAGLLFQAGDQDGLRARANAGDRHAAEHLHGLLIQAEDLDGLRARADAGDWHAGRRLVELLADAGDQDGLRARADTGDWHAGRRLVELLVEVGERHAAIDILRARADAGDWYAAEQMVELLVEVGERHAAIDILCARADIGDGHAARRLVELLADAGDQDGLRARADTGDWDAAGQLARLLAEAGDLDGLRARADTGDWDAAGQLARLLAEAGDLDGLRARADTGDRAAADQLARQLADAGNDRLKRFGFDIDGRIANGPTW